MLNIVIPAVGVGQRFKNAGYRVPKPLIDVEGEPMLMRVMQNLAPKVYQYKMHVIMPREYQGVDIDRGNLNGINARAIFVDEPTNGAACTALLARKEIDNDDPLIVASCDQLVDFSIDNFIDAARAEGFDGQLLTYTATEPYHSFCTFKDGKVFEVAEKRAISDIANVGVYYFGKGSDFVDAAERMIEARDTYKDEYYVAPVYNYLQNRNIQTYHVEKERVHLLGTPQLLRAYLRRDK